MAQSDSIQPSEFFNYNYAGCTINTVNNVPGGTPNTSGWLFDYDQGTGNYKGVAAIAENQDGSCTFWFWDMNFADTNLSFANFQFTWYSENKYANFAIDRSGQGQPQQYFMASSGVTATTSSWYEGPVVNGFSSTSVATPSFDSVMIDGFPVFRARLWPVVTDGSKLAGTSFRCSNIYHYTVGGNTSYFNDGGAYAAGFTLYWTAPPPPPPKPVLVSVTPTSGAVGTSFSVSCTNMPRAGYTFYLSPTATLQAVNPIKAPTFLSSSLVACTVPTTTKPASYFLYASDGSYATNSLSFTVTASALHGPPATGVTTPPTKKKPPQPIGVSITPKTLMINQGDNEQFLAFVVYASGAPAPLVVGNQFPASQIAWSVIQGSGDGSIGTTSGTFLAGHPGTCKVQIQYTDPSSKVFTASATVTVAQVVTPPSPIVSLKIAPNPGTCMVGSTLQFTATALNALGKPVVPLIQWSVVNQPTGAGIPPLASINPKTGLASALNLTPGLMASWWASTTSNPPINLPPAHTGPIKSTPSATGFATTINYGATKTLPPSVVTTPNCWYARFTGYIITQLSGIHVFNLTASGGANLFINNQQLVADIMGTTPTNQPVSISLKAGVYNPIVIEWNQPSGTYNLQLNWTVPGGSSVLVPATALQTDDGNDTVTVVCETSDGSAISTSAPFKITGPPPGSGVNTGLATIAVKPSSAVVKAGSTQLFKAYGYDQFGVNFVITPTWSVTDTNGSGTVNKNSGLFLGEIAGNLVTVTATATDGTQIQGTANAVVIAGDATRLAITPNSASLTEGSSAQFIATAYDNYGNVVSLSNLIWSVAGGVGTVNGTGLFTAGSVPGIGKVIVRAGALSAAALINVLTIVGGTTATTFPQQPFARVRLRSTIDPPIIVDTRQRGGGLIPRYAIGNTSITPKNLQPQPNVKTIDTASYLWWDLQRWEGLPFSVGGVFFATAYQPGAGNQFPFSNPVIPTSINLELTATQIRSVLAKVAPPHFYAAVSSLSSLLFTTYPGNQTAQAITSAPVSTALDPSGLGALTFEG